MRTNIIVIFLLIITFSCNEEISVAHEPEINEEEKTATGEEGVSTKDNFYMPHIEVLSAELPIRLDGIDFKDSLSIQQISDGKIAGIEETIRKYYIEECNGNKTSLYSIEDIYLSTIQIDNTSNYILYWVILKHLSGKVNSKVLFFDNTKKEFSEYVHDFNIHALFVEEKRALKSSKLKEQLQMNVPEMELVDFDGDEHVDFQFKRLYHNGTANAIEKLIIEINETKVDTLKFEKEWITDK